MLRIYVDNTCRIITIEHRRKIYGKDRSYFASFGLFQLACERERWRLTYAHWLKSTWERARIEFWREQNCEAR